jgi:hypothetical protein
MEDGGDHGDLELADPRRAGLDGAGALLLLDGSANLAASST